MRVEWEGTNFSSDFFKVFSLPLTQQQLSFQSSSMESVSKQSDFQLGNGVKFSSNFESGNLTQVTLTQNQIYQLWIGNDPNSTYRTWFYFSVEQVPPVTTLTFCIMNMTNQVKLFKEGHLPVFKSETDEVWKRVQQPIQQNGVVKGEEGFQITFKHTFRDKFKYYFAFSYPWTYSQNNLWIENLISNSKGQFFCDYRALCLSSKKVELKLLTVTKGGKGAQLLQIPKLAQSYVYTFPGKKGVFISARVHPGEVASSHMCKGIIKFLFSHCAQAQLLLQKFVFYIIPMINPDGVMEGNFRCDSRGSNLNRYYDDPSPQQHPEIFGIKSFLLELIAKKYIGFCLDLHAHVNKQGTFIYGNSTSSLKEQLNVCLFPKLLEYNCKYFDYDSCNFSEKNMSSKDKSDQLSKEGASRVAIYKATGLTSCWTLECNYNSSRTLNLCPKPFPQEPNSKVVSNGVLTDLNCVPKKEEVTLLNVPQFEEIGVNIAETLLDYYGLRQNASYFNSKLKNMVNFQLSLAVNILRMIPFRFDNECRKIINAINSGQSLNQNFGKILQKIGQDPIMQYLSSKSLKERSSSQQKSQKKIHSVKDMDERVKREKTLSLAGKGKTIKTEVKKTVVIPNIPKVPGKK